MRTTFLIKKIYIKYDNRHDESEELTCSFSSEEEFDDNDCMDVSKASLSDEFDEKDDGDNLALRYIAGLKKKLTSTPNIESFKTRSSILRNTNTSNSNKETHQPKTSLFNSNLSPLVFQRRESAFEQNRNLLTKFVLTKNFESSHKKTLSSNNEIGNEKKSSSSRDFLKERCQNFQQMIEETIQLKDTTESEAVAIEKEDEAIELTQSSQNMCMIEKMINNKQLTENLNNKSNAKLDEKNNENAKTTTINTSDDIEEIKECVPVKPLEKSHVIVKNPATKSSKINIFDMSHSKSSHPTSTPINNDKLKQHQLNEMQNSAIGPRNPPQNQCFNAEEGSIIDYEYSLVVPDTQPLPTYKVK